MRKTILTLGLFLFSFLNALSAQTMPENLYLEHVRKIQELVGRSSLETKNSSTIFSRLEDHETLYHYTRSLGSFLIQEIQNQRALSGNHLNLIHRSLSAQILLTERLLKLADDLKPREINFTRDPQDSLSYLAIQVAMTERFKTLHSLYFQETLLRRIVSSQALYEQYGLTRLPELSAKILNAEKQREIVNGLKLAQRTSIPQNSLATLLKNSGLYRMVLEDQSVDSVFKANEYWSDRVNNVSGSITRALSWAYGQVVGDIEWRTGHLHNHAAIKRQILSELKPLDLVYEKKSFKLTDYTIPGNWGHLAVWLGTKEDLIKLGLWDRPELDAFRNNIENGYSLFEVRRWGLQFDNIDNFLNLDEIAINRVSDVLKRSNDDIADVYYNLSQQMNKTYDFTFNALATDRATCTEIVFLSYGQINWPRDQILGRTTITPNNMAEIVFYENSPVEFISYYTATERHKIQKKSIQDFGSVIDYVVNPKRSRNGKLSFDLKSRDCKNVRNRRNGGLRMEMVCKDKFEQRFYTPSNDFNHQLPF